MIVDCISDLHGHYPQLEGGDLLIVAGDLTAMQSVEDYIIFEDWFAEQNYRAKMIVAGNHDNHLVKFRNCISTFRDGWHLCDSGCEFERLKIWGSPWTKTFEGINPHCTAFTCDTDEELAEKWALIPEDTDILITHSPPWTILDQTTSGERVGSRCLIERCMDVIKPKLSVFGHIHESYGACEWNSTKFVNASHVNEFYQPVNKTIRIEL